MAGIRGSMPSRPVSERISVWAMLRCRRWGSRVANANKPSPVSLKDIYKKKYENQDLKQNNYSWINIASCKFS